MKDKNAGRFPASSNHLGIPSDTVRFRIEGRVLLDLMDRGDAPGLVARRDLERYYALLRQGLRDLRAQHYLNEGDATVLRAAVQAGVLSGPPGETLVARLAPWLYEQGADVVAGSLLGRLDLLTAAAQAALLDAAERAERMGGEAGANSILAALGLTYHG